jgi:hypothetical protein
MIEYDRSDPTVALYADLSAHETGFYTTARRRGAAPRGAKRARALAVAT